MDASKRDSPGIEEGEIMESSPQLPERKIHPTNGSNYARPPSGHTNLTRHSSLDRGPSGAGITLPPPPPPPRIPRARGDQRDGRDANYWNGNGGALPRFGQVPPPPPPPMNWSSQRGHGLDAARDCGPSRDREWYKDKDLRDGRDTRLYSAASSRSPPYSIVAPITEPGGYDHSRDFGGPLPRERVVGSHIERAFMVAEVGAGARIPPPPPPPPPPQPFKPAASELGAKLKPLPTPNASVESTEQSHFALATATVAPTQPPTAVAVPVAVAAQAETSTKPATAEAEAATPSTVTAPLIRIINGGKGATGTDYNDKSGISAAFIGTESSTFLPSAPSVVSTKPAVSLFDLAGGGSSLELPRVSSLSAGPVGMVVSADLLGSDASPRVVDIERDENIGSRVFPVATMPFPSLPSLMNPLTAADSMGSLSSLHSSASDRQPPRFQPVAVHDVAMGDMQSIGDVGTALAAAVATGSLASGSSSARRPRASWGQGLARKPSIAKTSDLQNPSLETAASVAESNTSEYMLTAASIASTGTQSLFETISDAAGTLGAPVASGQDDDAYSRDETSASVQSTLSVAQKKEAHQLVVQYKRQNSSTNVEAASSADAAKEKAVREEKPPKAATSLPQSHFQPKKATRPSLSSAVHSPGKPTDVEISKEGKKDKLSRSEPSSTSISIPVAERKSRTVALAENSEDNNSVDSCTMIVSDSAVHSTTGNERVSAAVVSEKKSPVKSLPEKSAESSEQLQKDVSSVLGDETKSSLEPDEEGMTTNKKKKKKRRSSADAEGDEAAPGGEEAAVGDEDDTVAPRKKKGRASLSKSLEDGIPGSPNTPCVMHTPNVSSSRRSGGAESGTGGGRGRGRGRWGRRRSVVDSELATGSSAAESKSVSSANKSDSSRGADDSGGVSHPPSALALKHLKRPVVAPTRVRERALMEHVFSRESDLVRAYQAIGYMVDLQQGALTGRQRITTLNPFAPPNIPKDVRKVPLPILAEVTSCLGLIESGSNFLADSLLEIRRKQVALEHALARKQVSAAAAVATDQHKEQKQQHDEGDSAEDGTKSMQARIKAIQEQNKLRVADASLLCSFVPLLKAVVPAFEASDAAGEDTHGTEGADKKEAHIGPVLPHCGSSSSVLRGSGSAIYSTPQESPSWLATVSKMAVNREAITREIRNRKVRKRHAWEVLGDHYASIHRLWKAHVDTCEKDEVDGPPRLRGSTESSRASNRISGAAGGGGVSSTGGVGSGFGGVGIGGLGSTSWTSSSSFSSSLGGNGGVGGLSSFGRVNSGDIIRSDYDQERLLQQLAQSESMKLRIKRGAAVVPSMISPWLYADSSKSPPLPKWPTDLREFVRFKPAASSAKKSSKAALQSTSDSAVECDTDKTTIETPTLDADPIQLFPDFTPFPLTSDNGFITFVDLSGSRLTKDGRRQICARLAPSVPCPVGCNCARQVDRDSRFERVWSDMEKAIFLDKFMQFPKNFSKIASFLANRSVQDCIKFYYDSKTKIPYKSLLREFDNRRRNLKNSWAHAHAAAKLVGCSLYPFDDVDDKEPFIELPVDDATYHTFLVHPPHTAEALGAKEPVSRAKKLQTYPRWLTMLQYERRDSARKAEQSSEDGESGDENPSRDDRDEHAPRSGGSSSNGGRGVTVNGDLVLEKPGRRSISSSQSRRAASERSRENTPAERSQIDTGRACNNGANADVQAISSDSSARAHAMGPSSASERELRENGEEGETKSVCVRDENDWVEPDFIVETDAHNTAACEKSEGGDGDRPMGSISDTERPVEEGEGPLALVHDCAGAAEEPKRKHADKIEYSGDATQPSKRLKHMNEDGSGFSEPAEM